MEKWSGEQDPSFSKRSGQQDTSFSRMIVRVGPIIWIHGQDLWMSVRVTELEGGKKGCRPCGRNGRASRE